MMDFKEKIVFDPDILLGKPIIRGTRISVVFLLDLLANDWSFDKILNNYPQLTKEDIQAALEYAVETLKEEKVYPVSIDS